MDEQYFVAITDISHGFVDGDGVNQKVFVEAGTKLTASEIGDEELVAQFIEQGSIAEFKDVIVVEDTARIEELEAEKAEKDARIAELEAALAAKNNPQQ